MVEREVAEKPRCTIHTSLRGKEFHVNSNWSCLFLNMRDVTDGMRTPWKLLVNAASKNLLVEHVI